MQEGSTPGTGHSCLPGLCVCMGTRGKACRERLMPEHPSEPQQFCKVHVVRHRHLDRNLGLAQ